MSHTPKDLNGAVRLQPVHIPKPWGQEIWFTGMEARGESEVLLGDRPMPLSQYLALDPRATCDHQDVLLLKILDPAPTPVIGDLYFELHEEKREVYIVTHVDKGAWPDGSGGIRFGMDQQARAEYDNDEAFRAAFASAVSSYEAVRRHIDETPEQESTELAAQERELRAAMERFTHTRALSVGDVVRVPTLTPHALQHGVRVVEFQTPTYERLIISFAQKVLTQDHWDTEAAVAQMHVDTPAAEVFEEVEPGIERIARFHDFNVWRVNVMRDITLPEGLPYAVCMAVKGETQVGNLTLKPEQACFVPSAAIDLTRICPGKAPSQLLIAAPGL